MTCKIAVTASLGLLLASASLVALTSAAMADPLLDGEDLSGFNTNDIVPLINNKNNTSTGISDNLYLTTNAAGDVFFSVNQPEGLNNNSYGTTSTCGATCGSDPAYNWSGGHKLSDLLGSDQVDMTFYNKDGSTAFTFNFDYSSTDSKGNVITCGDLTSAACGGSMSDGSYTANSKCTTGTGTGNCLTQYATSLSYNCKNNSSFCGTNGNSPTPTQNAALATKWVNQIIYQGEISHLAFTNGFGGVSIDLQHDSPAEDGFDQTNGCKAGSGGTGVNGTCGLNPQPVPEPGTLSLIGGGLFGLGFLRRFRRKRS
jgi:hypothetical protein